MKELASNCLQQPT